MVSRTEDTIDFQKLEQEVHNAVAADAKYWRENDAKFRAVNQKVATYEEFRDIVLAAHLKPFEKEDRLDNIKFVQPWNQVADHSKDVGNDSKNPGAESEAQQSSFQMPRDGHTFARDWRRLCKTQTDRYAFLLWICSSPGAFDRVFKAEIGLGLLGEILSSLDAEYRAWHRDQVLGILESLSRANRFGLSVDFLSAKEKDACRSLFDKLRSGSDDDGDFEVKVKELAKKYGVEIS